MRHTPAWLAIPLVFAGCGTDDAAPTVAATVDTVGGVERITYPAEPGPPLDWSLDTVAVLGDPFAEDAYQFDGVNAGGLAADAEGNVYVLDRQGTRVLKYAPDGTHLATYGREGAGPGEIGQPMALAVGPHDTIWVSDFDNTRLTGFPQDGGDPRTIPLPDDAGIPGERLAVREDGFITMFRPLFMFGPGGMTRPGEEEGSDEPPMLPVLRLTPMLEPVDTLWSTREPPMDMVQIEVGNRIMISMTSREFYPEFAWAPFPDSGLVVVDSVAYALHLVDGDGDVVRTVARDPAPRATTEADRELARQRMRDESEQGGVRVGSGGPDEDMQAEILRQRLEKMTFADLIPRVVGLRVDPAGRIWVGVSEETPDEVERIDVYDRDGALIGELRGFPVPDVFLGPDRIGVLRRDELDVQQLVILDIQRPRQVGAASAPAG